MSASAMRRAAQLSSSKPKTGNSRFRRRSGMILHYSCYTLGKLSLARCAQLATLATNRRDAGSLKSDAALTIHTSKRNLSLH